MFQLSLVSALDSGGEGLLGVGPRVGGVTVAQYPESALWCSPSRVGGGGQNSFLLSTHGNERVG